jgi:hypothetical protein
MRSTPLLAALAAAALLAPAAASADSISYVKDGDVWLTTPDGGRQHRVTTTGGYTDASQADDGTLVALSGVRLRRLDRHGKVLADFAPPRAGAGEGGLHGPFAPSVSPDGRRVSYTFVELPADAPPGCVPVDCRAPGVFPGTAVVATDGSTAAGTERHVYGWTSSSWLTGDEVLLSRHLPGGRADVAVGTTTSWYEWFDAGETLREAEVSRGGEAIVAVAGPASERMHVFRARGGAPVLPEACIEYSGATGGRFSSPTFAPDAKGLAWAEGDGVWVGAIPAFAGGCTTAGTTSRLLVPGATQPDWGPADLPAPPAPPVAPGPPAVPAAPAPGPGDPRPVVAPPVAPVPAPAAGVSVRLSVVAGQRLRTAVRRGLKVRVSGPAGTTVAVRALLGRRVVATGRGRAGTTVTLRFTRAGRAAVGRRRSATLAVVAGPARASVTLR